MFLINFMLLIKASRAHSNGRERVYFGQA